MFPVAPCVSDGQFTVLPEPSVQAVGAALVRNVAKFCVVPELSARRATVIAVLGSFTPGLSAAILASSHFVIVREKIPAIVSAESCRLFTPDRLYDTVIGPATVGKYRYAPPLGLVASAAGYGASVPAQSTTWSMKSWRPLPEPPPA